MTDNELLTAVKAGLGISGSALDAKLLVHVKGAKGMMVNYGVATDEIESDLGIQCLTAGVQDFLNPSPGGMQFSPATLMILQQLHHVSLEEVE
jgi:hypothetical protein